MKIALLIAIAAMSAPAMCADVYKCQDAAGKIEFRDRPCDVGHKGQKIDVTPNSIGTMTLEEVRAKSAELKAKQQARQDAESAAQENARLQERAWIDLQQATRDGGANGAQAQIPNGYYPGQPRAPAMPSPPPSPPRAPAMPTSPPRLPGI